jgi:hypothetical protein
MEFVRHLGGNILASDGPTAGRADLDRHFLRGTPAVPRWRVRRRTSLSRPTTSQNFALSAPRIASDELRAEVRSVH